MTYTIDLMEQKTREIKRTIKKDFPDYGEAVHWAVRFCLKTASLIYVVRPKDGLR